MNHRHSEKAPFRRWLVVAIAVPIGVFVLTSGLMSIPRRHGDLDVTAGRNTFRAHCGGCHFAKEGFPAHHGPNLFEIGRTAATRKPNQTAAEYILESILDPDCFIAPASRPGMPRNVAAKLSPREIRNVLAFLAGRGAFPDFGEIALLDVPDQRREVSGHLTVRAEDMEIAEQVMREKASCFDCHAMHSHPEYKVFAPGLFGVGLIDRAAIQTSLIDPHQDVSPQYRPVTVVLANGKIISGRLISRSSEQIALLTTDDQGQSAILKIPLREVEQEDGQYQILPSPLSPMPTGFDQSLTSEERDAVTTLIQQLN